MPVMAPVKAVVQTAVAAVVDAGDVDVVAAAAREAEVEEAKPEPQRPRFSAVKPVFPSAGRVTPVRKR